MPNFRWLPFAVLGCGGVETPPCAEVVPYGVERLTPTQIRHALQDVLGVEPSSATSLPAITGLAGFDVTADAAQIDPTWLGQLLGVARTAAHNAVTPEAWSRNWQASELGLTGRAFTTATGEATEWLFIDRDTRTEWTVSVPEAGDYTLSAKGALFVVWEFDDVTQFPDGTPPTLSVQGASSVGSITWDNLDRDEPARSMTLSLPAGETTLTFIASVRDEFHLLLGDMELRAVNTASTGLRPDCDLAEDDCPAATLQGALRRLYRRPVSMAEAKSVLASASEDATPELRLEAALQAAIIDPNFVLRPSQGRAHDLASRLALALWASVPDDRLLDCAARGDLLSGPGACGRTAQIDRMLADSRSDRMLRDFATQWLGLTELDTAVRDAALTTELREAMVEEVVGILRLALSEDLPVQQVVGGDWTWANGALAAWYGADLPVDASFQRLSHPQRGGLVRTGAFAAAHALPSRTSPIFRGVGVLTAFLCDPPGAQPPTVPPLPEDGAEALTAMEAHRALPGCSSCHASIDPLGLSLESYDSVGRWRDAEALGTLEDGTVLAGGDALADWLTAQPEVRTCVAEKLATYTRGRVPTEVDSCEAEAAAAEDGLGSMLRALLTAPGFTP